YDCNTFWAGSLGFGRSELSLVPLVLLARAIAERAGERGRWPGWVGQRLLQDLQLRGQLVRHLVALLLLEVCGAVLKRLAHALDQLQTGRRGWRRHGWLYD